MPPSVDRLVLALILTAILIMAISLAVFTSEVDDRPTVAPPGLDRV
jgi:hypothetical protein